MRWRGSLGWVAAAMVCWAARLEGQILLGPSCAWMERAKQHAADERELGRRRVEVVPAGAWWRWYLLS